MEVEFTNGQTRQYSKGHGSTIANKDNVE